MLVHTQTEAQLLGFDAAASKIAEAATLVATDLGGNQKSILPDDILGVVEQLAQAKVGGPG